jgi:hypothetical protein
MFSVGFGGGKRSGLVSIVQLESAAGNRSDVIFGKITASPFSRPGLICRFRP